MTVAIVLSIYLSIKNKMADIKIKKEVFFTVYGQKNGKN